MKKNIFKAFFVVCTLFLVSSCSEEDDDNSALMMQVVQQSQGSSSVSESTRKFFGTKADGSKYELEIKTDYVSGNGTISLKFTSADESVLQLLTIYKPEYNMVFTHYDKNKSFTLDSYDAFGFMTNSGAANLENRRKKVEDDNVNAFNAMGKLPSDTITAIKNCTSLEFILENTEDDSSQISISFENQILKKLQESL